MILQKIKSYIFNIKAGWQSGYAEDCKSLYAGSIPTPASNLFFKISFFDYIKGLFCL